MPRDSFSVVGLSAPQFIEFLVDQNPDIQSIELFRPPLSRPIQDDPGIGAAGKAIIQRALELREETGLPFWDSALLRLTSDPTGAPDILKRAKLHNQQEPFSLTRGNCNEKCILELIAGLTKERVLAISSRVRSGDGRILHIPMLDFHCKASVENDLLTRRVINAMELRGFIANSGRSYHFYGRTLVDQENLIAILARALLFCPIVDRAWVAHQLLERACGLRISAGKSYLNPPVIIDEV